MPKQLSKSEVLQMRLKGLKADDGADLELDDEEGEAVAPDVVVGALADLGRQTAKMTAALTELNRIIGNSLVSLAEIVEQQSASIEKLATGIKDMASKTAPDRKPREYVFDVQRGDSGRINKIMAKEVNK